MKKAIRAEVRKRKREHTAEQLAAMSMAVCCKVMRLPQWTDARCVLLYHPLPDEVDVRPLLDVALSQGKMVLLPQVATDETVADGLSNELILRRYTGPDSLQPGAFGIMEPTGELFPPTAYPTIDLAIIPGMAFDDDGHRLGRGRGYYDRLLPRLPHAFRLGIAFPFQRVVTLPTEPHDVAMNVVLA